MSGIAGIVQTDGSLVEPTILDRLTTALAYRGPDGAHTWTARAAGLGGAWLRVAAEGADNPGPVSLDGTTWIVADARIDGRHELATKLTRRDGWDSPSLTDAQLILGAYEQWGEACVEHLIGDFAFAIWDGARSRLFCARDHFGVKPFYYAQAGPAFLFSNTLECLHLHPGVSRRPNDLAVADFLLFGYNQDTSTTSFADVRRLPPAHSLTVVSGSIHCRRFWTLPRGRIRYRRSRDYVERFTELLQRAVSDRLGSPRVGVWMSGGVDSTSVAAMARHLPDPQLRPTDVRAHTMVYDALMPDDERRFADLAAAALGIEVRFTVADTLVPFLVVDDAETAPPEPIDDPFFAARLPQLRDASRHSRILLCGEGGDEIFWPSSVVDLLASMPWQEVGGDVARSLLVHRRRPPAGIARRLRRPSGAPGSSSYPAWLNSSFARRLDLRDRWNAANGPGTPAAGAGIRHEARRRLAGTVWPWYFECADPGTTRVGLELRYPLLDVRLVEFMLAIPPLPWCIDKHLLRVAVRGLLPGAVRRRRKSPLQADPLRAYLRAHGGPRLTAGQLGSDIDPYVDRAACPDLPAPAADPWVDSRPHALDRWLRQIRRRSPVTHGTERAERAIHEEAI